MTTFIRKTWYTLTEAVDFLNHNTEGNMAVRVSDLYQLAANAELTLTVRLFSNARASSGRIVSRPEDDRPLPQNAIRLTGSDNRQNQYFLPEQDQIVLEKGDYWNLTLFAGGSELIEHSWRASFRETSRDFDKLLPAPLNLDEPDEKVRGLKVPEPIFLTPFPSDETDWGIRIKAWELPSDAMVGLTVESLNSLLGDEQTVRRTKAPNISKEEETHLSRAQRTLAALALALMKKNQLYQKGDKPNYSQIANLATEHLRDPVNDRGPYGLGTTTVKNAIKDALASYPELNE